MQSHSEFQLPDKIANRIVVSAFWPYINSVVKQIQNDFHVNIYHIVNDQKTEYETQLGTADEGELEIRAEAQMRAIKIVDVSGATVTQFRVQCRFETAIDLNGLVGFNQIGRILNQFAVVDQTTDQYNEFEFTPWQIDRT